MPTRCYPGPHRLVGPKITEYYGWTGGSVVSVNSTEQWMTNDASIGQAVPNIEIMVTAEDDKPSGPNKSGDTYFYTQMGTDFEYHNAPFRRRYRNVALTQCCIKWPHRACRHRGDRGCDRHPLPWARIGGRTQLTESVRVQHRRHFHLASPRSSTRSAGLGRTGSLANSAGKTSRRYLSSARTPLRQTSLSRRRIRRDSPRLETQRDCIEPSPWRLLHWCRTTHRDLQRT